jgi:hypothetical protein
MMFELLLDAMDRFLNLRDTETSSLQSSYRCPHLHESYRTLRDASFGVALSPGTSCQATIAPSLRDISQQALVRSLESPAFAPPDSRLLNSAPCNYSIEKTPNEIASICKFPSWNAAPCTRSGRNREAFTASPKVAVQTRSAGLIAMMMRSGPAPRR